MYLEEKNARLRENKGGSESQFGVIQFEPLLTLLTNNKHNTVYPFYSF